MEITIKCSPKFDPQKIVDDTINKQWFRFQELAFELGSHLLNYMQTYINSHRHRSGGTGNLAKSIKLYPYTGMGETGWGIGLISELVPYWHVLAYGKKVSGETFIPGGGKAVPGYFGTGNAPDASLKGTGTQPFTYKPKSFIMKPGIIRPIPYVDETKIRMYQSINRILSRLREVG